MKLHAVVLWDDEHERDVVALAKSALIIPARSKGRVALGDLTVITWRHDELGWARGLVAELDQLFSERGIPFAFMTAQDPSARFEGLRGLLRCYQFQTAPLSGAVLAYDDCFTNWRARRIVALAECFDADVPEYCMVAVRNVGLDWRIHYVLLDPAALLSPILPSLAEDYDWEGGLLDYPESNLYRPRSVFPGRLLSVPTRSKLDDLVAGIERVARRNRWKVDQRSMSPLA